MGVITCPICGHSAEPAAQITTIAVCAGCGSSLAVDAGGHVTRAMATDTATLSLSELEQLRRARGAVVRRER